MNADLIVEGRSYIAHGLHNSPDLLSIIPQLFFNTSCQEKIRGLNLEAIFKDVEETFAKLAARARYMQESAETWWFRWKTTDIWNFMKFPHSWIEVGRQTHTFLWWSDLLLRIRRRHRMGSRGANLKLHSQKCLRRKKYFATSLDSLPLPASPKKRFQTRVSDFNESFLVDAFRIERFFSLQRFRLMPLINLMV